MFREVSELQVILHSCDLLSQGSSKCTQEELFDEPCHHCHTLRKWVLKATKIILHNLFSYHFHSYMNGSDVGLLNCGVFTAEGAAHYLNTPCVSKFDAKNADSNPKVVRAFLAVYFPHDHDHDEDMLSKEMWPYVVLAAQNQDVCTLSKLHVQFFGKEDGKNTCNHVQIVSHAILSSHFSGALRFNACVATEMYSGAIRHALVNVLLQFHWQQQFTNQAIADLAEQLS